MLLNICIKTKICIIEVINYSKIDVETQFKKIKSLVAWSISEGRVDQKNNDN